MEASMASPSMASDALSKPSSPAAVAQAELTPRSKVRALLALSDDSDFDSPTKPSTSVRSATPSSSKPRQLSRRSTPSPRQRAIRAAASVQSESDHASESSQESDAVPVRRMGKTVARLYRQASAGPVAPAEQIMDIHVDQHNRPPPMSTPQRAARSVSRSPGLFVSPSPRRASAPADESTSQIRSTPQLQTRKLKKPRKSTSSSGQQHSSSPGLRSDQQLSNSEDADSEVEDRLTQQTRVSKRKASKKALEEMHRETQRMARNQQLSHQAQVRKKITKQDLFQRFNFRQDVAPSVVHPDLSKIAEKSSEDELMMSGALMSSDIDMAASKDTPPTSPARPGTDDKSEAKVQSHDKGGLSGKPSSVAQNTAAASVTKVPPKSLDTHGTRVTKQYNVVFPTIPRTADSSDDELEIMKPNAALAILNQLPSTSKKDSSQFLHLRHLANLTSPSRKRKHAHGMTAAELQAQLREKARQQAINEKSERIAQLKAKGIHVQSFEEREKEQLELENLLEKARVDAVDIAKKERAAAKKAGIDVDEDAILDDDDDEDWDGEDEADQSEAELAMSGSEDSDAEEDINEVEDVGPSFFANEAEESDEDISQNITEVFSIFKRKPKPVASEAVQDKLNTAVVVGPAVENSEVVEPDEEESDTEQTSLEIAPRLTRRRVIDDDDEDEDDQTPAQTQHSQQSPNDAAQAAFGFKAQAPALGLSQLLESTLAGPQQENHAYDADQDSLAFLRQLPDNSAPQFATPSSRDAYVPDSQDLYPGREAQVPATQIGLGISQLAESIGTNVDVSPTKFSELIEPTQDAGFALPRLPLTTYEEPVSTIDTVVMEETPIARRAGRLMRRSNVVVELSDDESEASADDVDANAFGALLKGAKKSAARQDFNKKKSAAKELVEEQAEESEDEYAGLGGVSDDESNGEIDEEMQKMMDDSNVEVNEQALQALHADKQRAEDEKRLNQLYKDITTGGLRRKRGAAGMDDLSDHEDDALERRRRKQEEFARMRRALLADEKIGKIAQNPKQQAFFHAIEDRDELDGLDYMDRSDPPVPIADPDATDEPQAVVTTNTSLAAQDTQKRKMPSEFANDVGKENIPPKNPRRTAASESVSRPTPLAEIRESLSFFLEDSVPETQLDADDDSDEEGPFTLQRSDTNTSTTSVSSKASVINRLMRTDSEDSMTSKPLAFQTGSAAVGPTFKVPSLLRRATNLSTASNSSTGTTTSTRSSGNAVRMGGSRKSNIHYQAREAERQRMVDIAEQKRKAQVKKTVMSTKGRSVFGLLRKESSGFE